MRLRIVATALASVSFQALAACPGDNWWSLEREWRVAQSVFVGKVVSERPDPGFQSRATWIAGTFYRLRVEETFRGRRAEHLELFSENSSGQFPMEIGKRYVVFASRCNGRLYAYSRGNSGVLPERNDVLERVRTLRDKRR